MKILIAEDDRLSRAFLKKAMEKYGACDVAVDGMEALDLYLESIKRQEPYDLLCLDIMMPKVDGLKTLKVIRGLEKQYATPPEDHLKIIMISHEAYRPLASSRGGGGRGVTPPGTSPSRGHHGRPHTRQQEI